MSGSGRPASVSAALVLAVTAAVLTLASWVLHLSFADHIQRALQPPGAAIHVSEGGWPSVRSVVEPGKVLVFGVVAALWYATRRPGGRALLGAVIATVTCTAVFLVAAVSEAVRFALGFFLASMASAADALSGGSGLRGGSGLPGGTMLGLGLAAVGVDVLLLACSVTGLMLLSTASCRRHLAAVG